MTVRHADKWHRIVIGNLKNMDEVVKCYQNLEKQGLKEWCIYTEAAHKQVKCSK